MQILPAFIFFSIIGLNLPSSLSPAVLAVGEALPAVKAGTPTCLGITALSVNGQVHSHGLPTVWHVEYGGTTSYGKQSPSESIPSRLAAHYRESWNEGWNGWESWCPHRLHFTQGGQHNGYISYGGSPRDDRNHEDGVGILHLTPYMYQGSINSERQKSAYLAGGDPDFRDAIIKLSVRGRDWNPNGTEIIWWSQVQSNIESNPDESTLAPNYKHPNWAYTGKNLTDLLVSGKWETAKYQLLNDTNYWSYGGNRDGEFRYDAYWSINETQKHFNMDLFPGMVMFVDPTHQPTGAIDFDEFEVVYHNDSLAFPTNGGRLISAPEDSTDNPATLNDGWRNGDGKMWKSAANPTSPIEFVYEFKSPVTIEKVQLHQHTAWPSKHVEILVCLEGADWQPLVNGTIPESDPRGANYNFLLKKKLSAPAKKAKVRILSGHNPEHWGLGEIEFFGQGAEYLPDDNWFHVNVDLLDLLPGETIHYRLVATNAKGTTFGSDQKFTLPANQKPHVITGPASRIGHRTAKVEGRLNPLGRKTWFYFEYGITKEYGMKSSPRYGGLQITPRLGFDTLTDLEPRTKYHYRLVAENVSGKSHGEDMTFMAK